MCTNKAAHILRKTRHSHNGTNRCAPFHLLPRDVRRARTVQDCNHRVLLRRAPQRGTHARKQQRALSLSSSSLAAASAGAGCSSTGCWMELGMHHAPSHVSQHSTPMARNTVAWPNGNQGFHAGSMDMDHRSPAMPGPRPRLRAARDWAAPFIAPKWDMGTEWVLRRRQAVKPLQPMKFLRETAMGTTMLMRRGDPSRWMYGKPMKMGLTSSKCHRKIVNSFRPFKSSGVTSRVVRKRVIPAMDRQLPTCALL
mmetsp:Transcript_2567/g.4767  ORF Transcript_2567/g.4767 Transcript_2567/m.4767 type:complete len:253 (+) Transcript_2567:349-1107(+)